MKRWWSALVCASVVGCGTGSSSDDAGGSSSNGTDSSGASSSSSSDGSSSSVGASSESSTADSSGSTTIGTESSSGTTGAEIGKCCFIDSSCSDVSEAECLEIGGNGWEAGYNCELPCPDEQIGACCLGDGRCVDGFTVDKCGSDHAGPGTTCKSIVCPR